MKGDGNMRIIILAGAITAALATPAAACRGTAEYPDTIDKIEQSTLTPERKKQLLDQLGSGNALHKQAHQNSDMRKMGNSIRILDDIKSQINR